ncbi:MAG: hypothetical protein MJZ19_00870 [Paludibacteraceae bacterium]|nr:hypothetical protein [Paludibacteraceae bacterium]
MLPYLKEDGSLDVERINKLPYEKYMDMMGALTESQVNEYLSTLSITESQEPVQTVFVDYDMNDERCGVDADVLLNKMRKKYGL